MCGVLRTARGLVLPIASTSVKHVDIPGSRSVLASCVIPTKLTPQTSLLPSSTLHPLCPRAHVSTCPCRYVVFCNIDNAPGKLRLNQLFNLSNDEAEINDLL